jgi:hypothetical protein
VIIVGSCGVPVEEILMLWGDWDQTIVTVVYVPSGHVP